MPAIGITGGIATGKTAFCECLRQIMPEAKFFDADQMARELVEQDEVKKEVAKEFGPDVFSSAGDLNREAIRAIVFQNAAKRNALEQILHPRIRRQWSAQAQTHRTSSDFFFADIPLLYETGGEILCDAVVVVACSPEIQLARLLERGMKASARREDATSEATKIIESQMPLDEKIRRSDHVVWNNDGREVLTDQARLLVATWRR